MGLNHSFILSFCCMFLTEIELHHPLSIFSFGSSQLPSLVSIQTSKKSQSSEKST